MIKTTHKLMLCGTAVASLLSSASALAQNNANATANGNDDIIVTAQRRTERLQDVPMSIAALPAQAAEDRGIRNLQDLGQSIAGVQINFQGAFTYPAVRGITSLTTGVGFENNVAVYIDGFYQPDSTAINADFSNLESIQVLKGPQGSLYGRNATGGALLIQTKAPSDHFTGKVDARYGSFDDVSGSLYLSGPLSDTIRFSIAGYARHTDGYYDLLDATGTKIGNAAPISNVSVRGKLQASLTENLTATAGVNYTEYSDPRGLLFTIEANRPSFYPAKVGRLYDPRTFATNRNVRNFSKVLEPTLKLVLETAAGDLTSYTGYAKRDFVQDFDADGTYSDFSYQHVLYRESTFQQSLDFNVKGLAGLDLVLGASYYQDTTWTDPSTSYASNALTSQTSTAISTKAWAAYIDGTYHLTDRFSVGFGGRYTSERRGISDYRATTFPGGVATVTTYPGGANPFATFNNFSPRGVLTYKIADNTNLYASVSRGFRSGFPQTVTLLGVPTLNPIKPETITAYEVGFKTASPTFRFEAAGYYYDYHNIQIGVTQPSTLCSTCGLVNLIFNAPRAEVYGFEASLGITPTEGLNLDASAAYLHARYTDFKNMSGTGLNAATGLNVSQVTQDWTGKQMARAPEFTATFAATYKVRNALAGGTIDMNGNIKYTSSYAPNNTSLYGPLGPAGLTETQRFRQSAFALLNASINWTDPSDTWTIGVWANNITNHTYRISNSGNGSFGSYGTMAWPRQVGARLGAKW